MRNLIILLAIWIFVVSCDDTDPNVEITTDVPNVVGDPNLQAVSKTETIGLIHLTNTYGRTSKAIATFNHGTITWDFAESEVTITNSNTDASKEDSFDSGVYDYSLEDSNQAGVSNLVVDGELLGLFYYENGHDSLTVFPENAEGYILNFLKIP